MATSVEDVCAWFQSRVAEGVIPGCMLTASRRGIVFVEEAWGATLNGKPCETTMMFPYGSFSKGYSATAIAMVQRDGGFEWDDPVSKYIPEFGCRGKETATIRHLMSHAAGIPSGGWVELPGPDGWEAAIAGVCELEAEWEPGSRTAYHGLSGQLLAAEIVRRVTGEMFADVVQRLVGRPLGATATFDTSVEVPWSSGATGPNAHRIVHWHPAGGVRGTLADMLLLLNFHLTRGDELLEMHRLQYDVEIEAARAAGVEPLHEPWAIGWMLRGDPEPTWQAKEGSRWWGQKDAPSRGAFSHAGTSAVLGIADPSTQVAVAVMATSELPLPLSVEVRDTAASLLGA